MAYFDIPEKPEYKKNIRKFEVTDPGHADIFNPVMQDLIDNLTYLRERIDQAVAVAVGRNQARVFDTTEDMEEWIADPANAGLAGIGANLYIRDTDVPDWWVSEVLEEPDESGRYYKVSQLETQKVDLTPIETAINELNTDIAGALFSITNLRKRVVLTVTTTEFHYTGAFVVIPANSYYALSAMAIYNDTAAEWIGIGNNNTYSPSCLENASAGRSHASCASIGYIAEETTLYIWAKYNATGENTILINGFCITPK